jgi:hypothetical protein
MAIDARVWEILTRQTKHGVCDTVALPFALKSISEGKRRIMKTQIFHHVKVSSSKNLLKQTKILQDIITL